MVTQTTRGKHPVCEQLLGLSQRRIHDSRSGTFSGLPLDERLQSHSQNHGNACSNHARQSISRGLRGSISHHVHTRTMQIGECLQSKIPACTMEWNEGNFAMREGPGFPRRAPLSGTNACLAWPHRPAQRSTQRMSITAENIAQGACRSCCENRPVVNIFVQPRKRNIHA